jgi:hypothetical protein
VAGSLPSQKVKPPPWPSKELTSSGADHRSTGRDTTMEPSTLPAPSTCCMDGWIEFAKFNHKNSNNSKTSEIFLLLSCTYIYIYIYVYAQPMNYPLTLSKACSPGAGVYLVKKVMSRLQDRSIVLPLLLPLPLLLLPLQACCCRYHTKNNSLHVSNKG